MCILKVYSKSRSFKEFAEDSPIPVFSVHDAGGVRRTSTGEKWDENRISFDVSDREWNDLAGQIQDAIVFLERHGEALHQLLTTQEVSKACLDFPFWSRLTGDVVNQNDYLPEELIARCGVLGLAIGMAAYRRDFFEDESHGNEAEQIAPPDSGLHSR